MTTNPEGVPEQPAAPGNKDDKYIINQDCQNLFAAYNNAVLSSESLRNSIDKINKSNFEIFHNYTKAFEPLAAFENQFKSMSSLFAPGTAIDNTLGYFNKSGLNENGYLKSIGPLGLDNLLASKSSLLALSDFAANASKSILSINLSRTIDGSIFSKYAMLSPTIESSIFSSLKVESALSGIKSLTKDFKYLDTYSQSFANNLISIFTPLTEATRQTLLLLENHESVKYLDLIRTPALELYTSAHATACVALEDDSLPSPDGDIEQHLISNNSLITRRLECLNPGLAEAYTGGLHALKTGGPDWQRHAMVSFRETLTHVIHILAPDDKVIDSGGEVHEGRPTRKARIKYIFSGVGDGLIHKFFEADIKAAIELFDLLSNITHKLGEKPSLSQLHYLQSRLAGLLSSMLAARGL